MKPYLTIEQFEAANRNAFAKYTETLKHNQKLLEKYQKICDHVWVTMKTGIRCKKCNVKMVNEYP